MLNKILIFLNENYNIICLWIIIFILIKKNKRKITNKLKIAILLFNFFIVTALTYQIFR